MRTYKIDLTEQQLKDLLLYAVQSEDDEMQMLAEILQEKIDRIISRELYTASKAAPTDEERQQARKQYLDKKGVPDAYRW